MPIFLDKEYTSPPTLLLPLESRFVAQRRTTMVWMAFPLGLVFGCWLALFCLRFFILRF